MKRSLVALLLAAACWPAAAVAAPERPNIILILADDLGHGDVSANGSSIPTPAIDSLARDGATLSQGYVAAAVCAPSRAALMTGRRQQSFGFEYNPRQRPDIGIPAAIPTLAERLKAVGYATALVGKWHLGQTPQHHPTARGFDQFLGFTGGATGYLAKESPGDVWMPDPVQGAPKGFWPPRVQRGTEPPANPGRHLTELLTDEAVAFVQQKQAQPFFLMLAYNAPHSPLQATADQMQPFQHITDPARRLYSAMVATMDAGIGRLLEAVDQQGLAEETLVIFLSDNGCAAYIGKGACSNAPFGGFKGEYRDGGIRVPMFLRWPGKIAPASRTDLPVSSVDLTATILAAAGAAPDRADEGRDLLPALGGKAPDGMRRRMLFWRTAPNHAVVDGPWKLLVLERSADGAMVPLLFNREEDPGETRDVAAQHPAVVKRLRRAWDRWNRSLPPPAFESQRTASFPLLADGVRYNFYN